MSYMFKKCKKFNSPLNDWNVSSVVNIEGMLSNCESFNQPLNSWNVSNIKDISMMFDNAKSFNQNLESWNVSKVEPNRMRNLFDNSAMENNTPSWYKD